MNSTGIPRCNKTKNKWPGRDYNDETWRPWHSTIENSMPENKDKTKNIMNSVFTQHNQYRKGCSIKQSNIHSMGYNISNNAIQTCTGHKIYSNIVIGMLSYKNEPFTKIIISHKNYMSFGRKIVLSHYTLLVIRELFLKKKIYQGCVIFLKYIYIMLFK
jgi:hypothetical protein